MAARNEIDNVAERDGAEQRAGARDAEPVHGLVEHERERLVGRGGAVDGVVRLAAVGVDDGLRRLREELGDACERIVDLQAAISAANGHLAPR